MPHIRINDIQLNVLDEGQGSPLLLVHGFPLDHTMWREQIARFRNTHRVIAPDLRGFGDSDVTPGTITMQRHADDLAHLLDALRIREPVCLCGLSMGGYVAWQFVQMHHSRLGSLILCDTKAGADDEAGKKVREQTATRVLKEGPEFLAASMPEKLFSQKTRSELADIVSETQAVIRRTKPEGIAAAARGMAVRPDVTTLLPSITVPTLVIVGEEDAITPADGMQKMAAAIPGARFVSIAGAGHMAPLEDPAAVNAAMEKFLQR